MKQSVNTKHRFYVFDPWPFFYTLLAMFFIPNVPSYVCKKSEIVQQMIHNEKLSIVFFVKFLISIKRNMSCWRAASDKKQSFDDDFAINS